MKVRESFAISLLVFVGLVALSVTVGRGRLIFFWIYLFFQMAMLGLRVARDGTLAKAPLLRGYRPRPTDAGKWTEAPIAEVDKSTFGQLLASRMRREPGLQVYVRGRAPAVPPDDLYDPELDGRP